MDVGSHLRSAKRFSLDSRAICHYACHPRARARDGGPAAGQQAASFRVAVSRARQRAMKGVSLFIGSADPCRAMGGVHLAYTTDPLGGASSSRREFRKVSLSAYASTPTRACGSRKRDRALHRVEIRSIRSPPLILSLTHPFAVTRMGRSSKQREARFGRAIPSETQTIPR